MQSLRKKIWKPRVQFTQAQKQSSQVLQQSYVDWWSKTSIKVMEEEKYTRRKKIAYDQVCSALMCCFWYSKMNAEAYRRIFGAQI